MELETPVDSGDTTQNETPATAIEQPELAEPETTEEQTDDKPEADARDKAVRNLQRRVDRLTAAKYQTQASAEQAQREAETLRQRLAQYEQPEEQKDRAPDPIALAKEIARIERVTEKANSIAKDGGKRFSDFQSALQTVNREAGALFDQYGRPTGLGEAVLDADDPAALLHHLGSDPDLAAEFADLTPTQQARRLTRLEIELSKPKEPTRSSAPKPITPVKSKASTDGLADELTTEEWIARRNAMARR